MVTDQQFQDLLSTVEAMNKVLSQVNNSISSCFNGLKDQGEALAHMSGRIDKLTEDVKNLQTQHVCSESCELRNVPNHSTKK